MVSLTALILESLSHKHDACLAYRAEWQNLLSVLQEWGVSPYNIKRSFFDIIHMGLSLVVKMAAYTATTNDEGMRYLTPLECSTIEQNAAMVGRSFRDLISLLRRSHVWIFFAYGRTHKNDF
jgi:hypothetical protein